jgi:hypothetical protein
MKFIMATAGHTWVVHGKNEGILKEIISNGQNVEI